MAHGSSFGETGSFVGPFIQNRARFGNFGGMVHLDEISASQVQAKQEHLQHIESPVSLKRSQRK